MAHHLGSSSCGIYYDSLSLKSSNNLATGPVHSTANGLCLSANGRRNQQRYKLVTDGVVQICRVPHAKNIIEKIRFSRFLRRWETHYINLNQNDISSETV